MSWILKSLNLMQVQISKGQCPQLKTLYHQIFLPFLWGTCISVVKIHYFLVGKPRLQIKCSDSDPVHFLCFSSSFRIALLAQDLTVCLRGIVYLFMVIASSSTHPSLSSGSFNKGMEGVGIRIKFKKKFFYLFTYFWCTYCCYHSSPWNITGLVEVTLWGIGIRSWKSSEHKYTENLSHVGSMILTNFLNHSTIFRSCLLRYTTQPHNAMFFLHKETHKFRLWQKAGVQAAFSPHPVLDNSSTQASRFGVAMQVQCRHQSVSSYVPQTPEGICQSLLKCSLTMLFFFSRTMTPKSDIFHCFK